MGMAINGRGNEGCALNKVDQVMAGSEQDMEEDISSVMGFSGFGKQKDSKKFNLEEIFEVSRRTAQEYSAQVKAKQDEQERVCGAGEEQELRPPLLERDFIGPPLPSPCGQSSAESDFIGPPPPPCEESGAESEEEDDMEDEEFDKQFPLSHEVVLEHGCKPVSAMALDPAGARLATGGYDYEVKLWDFAGMDSSLQSFRTLRPCQSHQISQLQYSPSGEMILVVAGNAQAKVLDRDGHNVMECPKGWQYIADMANTDGHISMLNGGCWHPKTKEKFITCSNDCTIRVWSIYESKKQLDVIKARTKAGKKVAVSACCYSRDGNMIAGALQDGSIHVWKSSGPYVRSSLQQHVAHVPRTDTSCLCFAHDNVTLLSRGGDDTLKLWDIRQFKEAVGVVPQLDNHFPVTDCVFNPNEQLILTGTSVRKGQGLGNLVFFDRALKEVHRIGVAQSSVVRCLWHPKLHQIFVGCGNGHAKVFFNPQHSQRGAKLSMVKQKRTKIESLTQGGLRVITPHALPMFREEHPKSLKRKREKARSDPKSSHKPELPVSGKGAGGRISSTGGSSIGAYMRKVAALERAVEKDEDPREAILKYAKMAEDNPFWVNPAYKSTQPIPVFQQQASDEDET